MSDFCKTFFDTVYSYYSGNRIDGLEAYLLKVREENEAERGGDYLAKKTAIANELGTLYRVAGKQEQSAAEFRVAAETVANLYGKGGSQYATAVNNLAGAYRLGGKTQEAVACFLEALDAFSAAEDADRMAHAATLNNLGLVYLSMRDPAEAERRFHEALAVLDAAAAEGENIYAEQAVTYNNLASACFLKGDDAGTEDFCRRAIGAYEKVEEDWRGHMGSVYNTLGSAAQRQGRKEEALKYYELAKKWLFRFFGKNYEYRKVEEKIAAKVDER